jgi:hypothetical protein
MKRNMSSDPMIKKLLLNASQRKYLTDRINEHWRKLRHSKSDDGPEEPAEVAAARKLVEDWEDKAQAEQEAREKAIGKSLSSHVKRLTETLLFEATESALAKVAEFEEMTWEEFESSASTFRRGSPKWDEEN